MARPLDPILSPSSIAVVGASRTPTTMGHQILANLIRYEFTGTVYPVNSAARSVHSIRAWPSVSSLPDPVDLAVICVPKQHVLQVAEECGVHGVKGLCVISAGFREVGGDGVALERELVAIARRHGMRLVGPNCMGVLNADPAVRMNATFAPSMPPFGRVGFVSQSGAMGLSVLDHAQGYGIGIGQFVSMGNKPDVSGNDLLLHWEDDETIGVILMYVENFGNPRRFLEIASRVTRKKPIIVVKSGRSQTGARAASSHTGALAANDVAIDALLNQAGVLRAGSVEELFDFAMAFSGPPLPRGRRVAVLTNSGGPGILAADALEANGLEVAELHPTTVATLRPIFPAEASLRNPLDMIASATPAGYRGALSALLADPGLDAVMAIFVPPLGVRQEDVAEAIVSATAPHRDKTVLGVLMGRQGLPQGRSELHSVGIPAYIFPESAARALAALCRYREWRERPLPVPETLSVDRAGAAAILDGARAEGRSRLDEVESLKLLACYGIPTAPAVLTRSPDQAVAEAERIGFPVVLKIVAPAIIHKTEAAGVQVGIGNAQEAREAYATILAGAARVAPGAPISGVLVQKMVRGGREMIVGVSRDPVVGPLLMFGLGGTLVEVLADVVFRLAPINRLEAGDMLRGFRGVRILQALRGAPAADLHALEEILLRVAQLAADFPVIVELDLNPVLAFGDGALAVDARVLLGEPQAVGR
ncbi:MAG: acetate--CoA ligase family protein [Gemmatimonadales bacterium]